MKKTNKSIKKLATYSTAAVAVIAATPQANAELVGYDVNPDSTIMYPQDASGDMYMMININNAGPMCDNIEDLFIDIHTNGSSSLAVWGSAYNGAAFWGNWNTSYITNVITTSYGGTIASTYTITNQPTVAVGSTSSSIGTTISESRWIQGQDASWAKYYSGTVWGSWDGKTGKYTGLRFNAFTMDTVSVPDDTIWESTLHYGWIYMDVGLNATSFTIRAWAYETTPEASVVFDMSSVNWNPVSPDWCSDTIVVPPIGTNDKKLKEDKVSIYSYDRNVRVSLDGIRSKGNISVYNMTGQKVQEQAILDNSNLVNIKGNSRGVFVVKVDVDGVGTRSQKVYIE